MKLEQAARQALDALEVSTDWDVGAKGKQLEIMRAITALREVLAEQDDGSVCARCGGIVYDPVIEQAEQEPVGNNDWKRVSYIRETLNAEQAEQEPVAYIYKESSPETGEFVFAAPVRTKDLTDDEIREALGAKSYDECSERKLADAILDARVVIQEYRRKNGIV